MNNQDSVNELPLVSLVITSFNRAGLISSAIKSALLQDYPNLEIIISDNCSTDNTNMIINEYIKDARVKYSINQRNIGMLPNFLKATKELAKGKYITYVSSDDYLVNKSFISEAVGRMAQCPTVLLVHSINASVIIATNERFLDESYEYYKDSFYRKEYVNGMEVFNKFPFCHSISFGGTLFDREKLIACDPFLGKVLSGDTQIVLKLLQLGDAAFLDKETYVVQRHGGNATSTVSKAQTYIDNLAYIEVPYQFAIKRNEIDKAFLMRWREDMYCNSCSQCMLNLYKIDKTEYKLFSSFLMQEHPVVFRRITKQFRWQLNKAIFARRDIGSMYLRSAKLYRQFKSVIRGHKGSALKHPVE